MKQQPEFSNLSMQLQLFQGVAISHSTIQINSNTSNLATQEVKGILSKNQDYKSIFVVLHSHTVLYLTQLCAIKA